MPAGQLDIENFEALLAYLRAGGHARELEIPEFSILAGGVSNRTVLATFADGRQWVFKQALAKLRVKVEWLSDPRRIEREAAGMRWLAKLAPPGAIPELVFLDPSESLLAMQAVPSPHENWKTLLLAGNVQVDHVRQFANLLGAVHSGASRVEAELAREFEDRSFFESLRIEPYYLYSAAQCEPAAEFLRSLVHEARQTRYTLVHGDYSPKNVLVRNGRLVLLDHEVIHFGDGAFDVGFAMAHFLSKAHHLTAFREKLSEAALVFCNTYFAVLEDVSWSKEARPRAARHTLACLLARCVGRSPLEYLSGAEREKQVGAVVQLMKRGVDSPVGIVDAFLALV